MLRERRAQARERRIVERAEKDAPRKRKGPDEVGGDLGGLLDDIFADTEESP